MIYNDDGAIKSDMKHGWWVFVTGDWGERDHFAYQLPVGPSLWMRLFLWSVGWKLRYNAGGTSGHERP